ncbi:dynein axonemal heavy chain 7 [Xylocopa sonorina]|uniref:dynein axonemal heavy chain 7 n=1 Tax=Xylocopa sonorina TaxID=1818115 RepID=UPI00403A8D19
MECVKCKSREAKRKQWESAETYTGKRLKVEHFRRFMVGLIVKPQLSGSRIDLSNDEDVNRYYNYICNGVDTVHTVEIQDDVVEEIFDLVPYHLRDRFGYLAESLLIEIKETFTRDIKRAILKYALQDPPESYLSEGETSQKLLKIKHVLPGLTAQVQKCRQYLGDNLFLINPCMKQTLDTWTSKFG